MRYSEQNTNTGYTYNEGYDYTLQYNMCVRTGAGIMFRAKTHDELTVDGRRRIGDDISDDAIQLVEDVTDTLRDWESRASVDWESRYRENDDEWRRRYMERFNASADAITTPERVVEEQKENVSDDGKKRTYEELFEEREG